MTRYFIGVSQEQFPPEELLRQAVAAEQAGFDGISSSDHLQPWWEGGESAHTWPWLGAAGQATRTILLGTGGLAGVIYGIIVYLRITTLKIDLIDRCWYGIFPVLMYGLLGVSAALMFVKDISAGLELIAAALVTLLIIGMRNAWDMATFMILGGPGAPGNDLTNP